jgi:hypothetical protein
MEYWSVGVLECWSADVLVLQGKRGLHHQAKRQTANGKRRTANVERYFWNNPRITEPITPPAPATVAPSPALPR